MTSNDRDIERSLLQAISERVGDDRFGLWFGAGTKVCREGDRLTLVVPSRFLADWIRNNFKRLIDEAAAELTGRSDPIRIAVAEGAESSVARVLPPHSISAVEEPLHAASLLADHRLTPIGVGTSMDRFAPTLSVATLGGVLEGMELPPVVSSSLPSGTAERVTPSIGGRSRSPRPTSPQQQRMPSSPEAKPFGRTFARLETFVAGPSNKLARHAADFAIQHPGKINPIYIHGTTSVGKTHLLEAICCAVRDTPRRHPPLFLTAEQFTNLFIDSLRQGGMPTFRNKFRDIALLVIDDIPFMAGKKQTQAEFMHLIDTLKSQGIQMVFSGDKPLGRLEGFRSEILARLEAGMVCEIKQPEQETLLAICHAAVARYNIPVAEGVCRFVTSRLNTHARQLFGALNLLHALHATTKEPITLAMAEETLDDLIRSNRRGVRLPEIDKAICEEFGLPAQSLQSKGRAKSIAQPRMLAMWLARKHTRTALAEIGRFFGDRSHSTVITAQKNVDAWIAADTMLDAADAPCHVAELLRRIEQRLLC